MEKKRYLNKKAVMCYTQILILVISMFAFSFLIYQSAGAVEVSPVKNSKLNFLKILGLLILQKLKQPILPMVSAQTNIVQCCEETKNGAICQEFLQQDIKDNCAKTIFLGQCKEFANCKPGCCYDKEEGICAANSPQRVCDGKWIEDAACNIPECSLGCCILGNGAKFTTKQRCNKLSKSYGLTPNFDVSINNELQCILFTQTNEEGACVFDEGECIFTTGGDCANKFGNFHGGYLCSNLELNTICEKQQSTGCIDNKYGVYWFDSCGNPENIYDTNKEKSWNNGGVLSPGESCGINSANGNQNSADCGNCDYFLGSICGKYRQGKDVKPSEGDYVCRDLGCNVEIYGKGIKKKNGESWCVYDGTIGNGKDVVGSRHIKHTCFNGEETIEPCADFRNEICVQSDIKIENGVFTEAACRINRWRECAEINTEQDLEKKKERCEAISDCELKQVAIDEFFTFPVCTPQYPPGFDLKNKPEDAQLVCGQASQKCTVIYVKKLSGWDCEANCDCEETGFTQQMNDYCISLGDCGGYVNILGYTDDAYTSGAGKIDLNQYKKYAKENPNQKPAEPGDYSGIVQSSTDVGEYELENKKETNTGIIAGGIIGGVASSALLGLGEGLIMAGGYLGTATITETNVIVAVDSSMDVSFGNGIGAGLGAAAGSYLAMKLMGGELPADAALVVTLVSTIGGMSAGMTAGSAATAGGAGATSAFMTAFLTAFIWAFIIAMIIIGIMKLFGIGDTKEKIIEFRCMPWQPPTGGLNCDLCDGNPMKPCSEYRCSSLGQTCEFVNKGTGEEKCVDNNPNDVSSPKISPLLGTITEGFEYYNIQTNGFELADSSNKRCILEYTQVEYGIKTDKPSQCKIGTSVSQTYEEMPEYFGGNNFYLTNHSSVMFMISPSAFQNQYNLTDEQMKSYGKIEYYVKCKSVNGIVNSASYVIKTCVKPGPDITPPYVTNTNPLNGAYTAYNQTEQNLEIWVNEPANCRWSIFNENYDLMGNEFECQTSVTSYSLYGWSCTTTLINTHIDEKFYIRCKDRPWASDNSSRNPMHESYVYNLVKSDSALIINSVEPPKDIEIFSNIEPVTIALKAQTSGGAEQGKAECSFSFDGNNFIRFFETYSTSHNQIFSTMTRGNYNINLMCEDIAGNVASAETNFKISIDDNGPKITRIFYESGLKIITDENSECRYAFSSKLSWENATMMSGTELEHTADWNLKTYYVQCSDGYGNKGGKIVIKPYTLT